MQNSLQPSAFTGVFKNSLAHPVAVQAVVSRDCLVAKSLAKWRYRLAMRRRDFMGNRIGIDDGNAVAGENIANGAFAAADSAGQTDYKWTAGLVFIFFHAASLSNSPLIGDLCGFGRAGPFWYGVAVDGQRFAVAAVTRLS